MIMVDKQEILELQIICDLFKCRNDYLVAIMDSLHEYCVGRCPLSAIYLTYTTFPSSSVTIIKIQLGGSHYKEIFWVTGPSGKHAIYCGARETAIPR